MRRFLYGATNRPAFTRPSVPYGQFTSGAPKPTKHIAPNVPLVPEMFTENSPEPIARTHAIEFEAINDIKSQTTIDLTSDK